VPHLAPDSAQRPRAAPSSSPREFECARRRNTRAVTQPRDIHFGGFWLRAHGETAASVLRLAATPLP